MGIRKRLVFAILCAGALLPPLAAMNFADAPGPTTQPDYVGALYNKAEAARGLLKGSDSRRSALVSLIASCDDCTSRYGDQLDVLLLIAASSLELNDAAHGALAAERIRQLPTEQISPSDREKSAKVLAAVSSQGWLKNGFLRDQLTIESKSDDSNRKCWALFWLGRCAELGLGGPADIGQAKSWYSQAKALGSADAAEALARLPSSTAQPAAVPSQGKPPPSALSKADQLEFDTLQVLFDNFVRDSATDQPTAGATLLERSAKFLASHPDNFKVWFFRAFVAYQLNLPQAGHEAGQKLKTLGGVESDDATVHQLMVLLNSRGWLDASTSNSVTNAPTNMPETFTNSIGMKLVKIKPGSFLMGSPASEAGRYDSETQHKVTLTKGFLMETTPVTQAQWKAVMGNNPSNFKGDDLPVETVSWNDAVDYCNQLSQKEGKHYRLPTEAEWEYACRAGTSTAYYSGDGEAALAEDGWYNANSNQQMHPVGRKKPNAWGLYDMLGNVWQWCGDWHGDYPRGLATDPQGPDNGQARVLRGGSWNGDPRNCRCAGRNYRAPVDRNDGIGFRVVLDSE